mgnify:CR=1 FL=1
MNGITEFIILYILIVIWYLVFLRPAFWRDRRRKKRRSTIYRFAKQLLIAFLLAAFTMVLGILFYKHDADKNREMEMSLIKADRYFTVANYQGATIEYDKFLDIANEDDPRYLHAKIKKTASDVILKIEKIKSFQE